MDDEFDGELSTKSKMIKMINEKTYYKATFYNHL